MSSSSYGIVDGSLPFRLGVLQDVADTELLSNADWPALAADALVIGLDTPTLRVLAGESARADPVSVRDLRNLVNAELHITPPTPDDAAWCAALILCQRAVDGEDPPYAVAMRIVDLLGFPDERKEWTLYLDLAGVVYQWDESEMPLGVLKSLKLALWSYATFQGARLNQMILDATSGGIVPSPPRRKPLRPGKLFPCACCGHLTMDQPPGSYDVCSICGWEDDFSQQQHPDMGGGANKLSLNQARQNYESGTPEPNR